MKVVLHTFVVSCPPSSGSTHQWLLNRHSLCCCCARCAALRCAAGLIEAVSLTAEAESDEELEGLEQRMGGGGGQDDAQRFALLRELWASTSA